MFEISSTFLKNKFQPKSWLAATALRKKNSLWYHIHSRPCAEALRKCTWVENLLEILELFGKNFSKKQKINLVKSLHILILVYQGKRLMQPVKPKNRLTVNLDCPAFSSALHSLAFYASHYTVWYEHEVSEVNKIQA